MLVLAVGLAAAYPADEVFRYADEDTKQSHYMEGEPGVNVNGGWEFESPEGRNYMLTYKVLMFTQLFFLRHSGRLRLYSPVLGYSGKACHRQTV